MLKYGLIAVVLAVIGGAAYIYLPSLLSQAQEIGNSKAPASANAPGGGGGPLGEVNGAMDVSDTLDGGSPSKPQARPARPPVAAQPAKPATNNAAKSAHGQ